jgi:hypothetical protein
MLVSRHRCQEATLVGTSGTPMPSPKLGRNTRGTVANVVMQMDGPIGEELVAAEASFDVPTSVNGIDTLGPRHVDSYSVERIHPVHACVEAQIDIYHNTTQKQWWADRYFFWLRAIATDLHPWSANGSIFDTNTQLLDPNHPLRKCHSTFWKTSVHEGHIDHVDKRVTCDVSLYVYCRQHKRFETVLWTVGKGFQLAAGLHTHREWAELAMSGDYHVRTQQWCCSVDGQYLKPIHTAAAKVLSANACTETQATTLKERLSYKVSHRHGRRLQMVVSATFAHLKHSKTGERESTPRITVPR